MVFVTVELIQTRVIVEFDTVEVNTTMIRVMIEALATVEVIKTMIVAVGSGIHHSRVNTNNGYSGNGGIRHTRSN